MYPPAPPPWTATPAPRKRPIGLIIALVATVVIAMVGCVGLGAYAAVNAGQNLAASAILPTPTATPQELITVQDSLAKNNLGWTEDSNCFFKDGSYHIKDGYYCYLGTHFSDTQVTVQVKQVSGPFNTAYGIVYRVTDNGTYYAFMVDGNRDWVDWKCDSNNCSTLRDGVSPAVNTGLGVSNTLSVLTHGSHFALSVNGTNLGETDDTAASAVTSGYVGLIAGDGIEAAFSNLTIALPIYK